MKVPVQTPNPKRSNTGSRNVTTPALCYEPTSVLDLQRSPSPVCGKPVSISEPNCLEWEEHVLQNFDWDSVMKELDFNDNSSSTLKNESIIHTNVPDFTAAAHADPAQFLHPDFNDICFNFPSQNLISLDLSHHNNNLGFDLIQELIRTADCVDSNQIQLAHVILDRLSHRLQSPVGKPLQRAAFFFKEALQSLLTSSLRSPTQLASWSDVVLAIKAYKAFSDISPIPMFNHFTINQALIETLEDSPPFIHVIDFDIGLGCHYASFMKELTEKSDYSKFTSPILRITAVVTENFVIETQLIKQCLSQYAVELNIRFQIEFVLFRTFEMVSFKSIKLYDGEKITILLSPTFFHRLGSSSSINAFVTDLRQLSPGVVVVVDSDGWVESGATSFRKNFVNGLEFYSIIFDSLDAAAASSDWGRKIEMFLLKPRIFSFVEECGRQTSLPWKETLYGVGIRPMQFSQLADFQIECLLGKMQVKGFYVAKRQAELVLCWQERPLIATSIWRC